MGRKHQINRLEEIYHTVTKNPGRKPGSIARLLGAQRSQVTRALPALEDCGYLLCEDEKGRLWPFEKQPPS